MLPKIVQAEVINNYENSDTIYIPFADWIAGGILLCRYMFLGARIVFHALLV